MSYSTEYLKSVHAECGGSNEKLCKTLKVPYKKLYYSLKLAGLVKPKKLMSLPLTDKELIEAKRVKSFTQLAKEYNVSVTYLQRKLKVALEREKEVITYKRVEHLPLPPLSELAEMVKTRGVEPICKEYNIPRSRLKRMFIKEFGSTVLIKREYKKCST